MHHTPPRQRVLWPHRKTLLAIIAASGFSYTTYAFAFILMNGYLPLVSALHPQQLIETNTLLLCLDMLLTPYLGLLANRVGRDRQMFWASIGMMLGAFPIFYLLQQAQPATVLLGRTLMVALGLAFAAPYHAWVQTLVPATTRARIASFGYALGSQLIGMPAAAVSLWLHRKTGCFGAPALYLFATAGAAAFAVRYVKQSSSND